MKQSLLNILIIVLIALSVIVLVRIESSNGDYLRLSQEITRLEKKIETERRNSQMYLQDELNKQRRMIDEQRIWMFDNTK